MLPDWFWPLKSRQIRGIGMLVLFICLLYKPTTVWASGGESPDGKFDAGKIIIGHLLDSYEWHILDIGKKKVSIPLPVILLYQGQPYVFSSSRLNHGQSSYKGFAIAGEGSRKGKIIRVLNDGVTPEPNATFIIDLSITKNVLSIFINAAFICFLFIRVGRKYSRQGSQAVPRGLQSFLEPIIVFVRDDIALSAIGHTHYMRFLPYLLTLFFFIFFSNLIGLIPVFPGGTNVTGNISVTLVLALFTFFTTQLFSNKSYWKHIFNTPGVPVWFKLPIPLMPIIELVGMFIKPFVLMVRLFANITAGHMILYGFVSLIFVLGSVRVVMGYAISPLALVFLIFMNFIELLVAFLQAYVFTLFSALFFGMAVPKEHH